MSKRNSIFVSILLIIAAVVIHVSVKDTKSIIDIEFIELFSGILFGDGITFLFQLLFRKKLG